MLEVEPLSLMSQVYLQIFLSQNSLREPLQALSLFENQIIFVGARCTTFLEGDIVQLLYLSAIIWVLVWVRSRTEIGLLREKCRLFINFGVHLVEHLNSFLILGCRQSTNSKLICNACGVVP